MNSTQLFKQLTPQRKAVESSYNRLIKNRNREWDLYGYDFGVHPINMAIGGIIPTKVSVIGARSGTGKSAIIAPMLEAASRPKGDNSRVEYLLFSWEMDPSIVIDRVVCSQVGLTIRQLNQGAKLLDQPAMAQINAAYDKASSYGVHYHECSTDIEVVKATALEFIDVCREKSKIEGVYVHPVICIDYLNMARFEQSSLRTYGIADFMNGIKQLCNQTEASAVIFAQLSRETDKQHRIPDRADFSDSSAIENAADNLLILYRPEHHGVPTIIDPETGNEVDSQHKMLIRVLKGRDYGTGDFLINCDIKYFRFWDLHHRWDYPYYEDYTDEDFWKSQFNLQSMKIAAQTEVPF